MSRLKRFAHSLFSGYIMLVANTVYTLASVPLALRYLPTNEEFALWGLTSSILLYINLVNQGLTGSASRILIDYKDRRASGEYGSVVQTTFLVGFAQAVIVLVAGLLITSVMGPLLQMSAQFRGEFFWLLAGQVVVTAITMSLQTFNLLLAAHQRYDIINHAGSLSFAVNFAAMWACFAAGFGVYSLLAGQFAGLVLTMAVAAWNCRRLKILPGTGEWGKPSWSKFHEIFSFAQDVFLYSIGCQLVATSQAMLLTRLVSLESVAAWTVNTRVFIMLIQVIYRIFDFSSSALAEMMVNGEMDRLKRRFRQIVELSMSLAVVAAVLFALGNSTFVRYWSHGRIHWPPVNDALLGGWLVLCVAVHAHTGLVGQSKIFRFMRYIFLIEGGAFIGLMFLMHSLGVIPPKSVHPTVASGNGPLTNTATVFYSQNSPLTIVSNGPDGLCPNDARQLLCLNAHDTVTTITAGPATGFKFMAGPGAVTQAASNSPTLTFAISPEPVLTITFADPNRPAVVITNPGAGVIISNAALTLSGVADENHAAAGVRLQLSTNNWMLATGTGNWHAPLTLAAGTTMMRAYDLDPTVVNPNSFQSLRGITVMLLLSIGTCLSCTFWYGLYRTRHYFALTGQELLGWHRQSLRLAAVLVPVAVAAWWGMQCLPLLLQLAVILPLTGLWSVFALLRFGLSASLQGEIASRLPFLKKITGPPA